MKPRICDFLPIPDLLKAKNVLCIQPHPDDMEIGAGATVALLSRSGTAVTCLTITDGSAGTYDPAVDQEDLIMTRRREAEKTAGILGINNLLWLDFADGGFLPYEDIRSEITSAIRRQKPDAVLVCDPWLPYEAHSDHNRTGLATAEACLLAGMPNFCPADFQEGLLDLRQVGRRHIAKDGVVEVDGTHVIPGRDGAPPHQLVGGLQDPEALAGPPGAHHGGNHAVAKVQPARPRNVGRRPQVLEVGKFTL